MKNFEFLHNVPWYLYSTKNSLGYHGCLDINFGRSMKKIFFILVKNNNGFYDLEFHGEDMLGLSFEVEATIPKVTTIKEFREALNKGECSANVFFVKDNYLFKKLKDTPIYQNEQEELNLNIKNLELEVTTLKQENEMLKNGKFVEGNFKIKISDTKRKQILAGYKNNFPILLYGPSGTGKSSLVREIGELYNLEITGLSFNGDTNVEHLLGHFVLDEGKMVFKDGPLTDAVRNGKIFLADELNASSPEIQFILNSLLENRGGTYGDLLVQSNHGERITPHPNFRFFGTYNPNYIGTKKFSNSLLSRFISIEIPPLLGEEEFKVLSEKYPNVGINILQSLCRIKEASYKTSDTDYDMSTRDIEQVIKLYFAGLEVKDAFEVAVLNNCQYDEDKLYFNKMYQNEFGKD